MLQKVNQLKTLHKPEKLPSDGAVQRLKNNNRYTRFVKIHIRKVNGITWLFICSLYFLLFFVNIKSSDFAPMQSNILKIPQLAEIDSSNNDDFFQLVENLPAAVYTCDLHGYIKFYNKAAAKLWGRDPEIGTDLWCGSWKIYHTDGSHVPLDSCPMAIALKEKREVVGEEIIVERPDGERRNILPHPKPIYNAVGEMIGAMNMLVDITENKRIVEMNHKLQDYNQQLEQFAFAASHDMQEPLRKITTFASLLVSKNKEQLDEEGERYLLKISESSKRMMNLINDLLGYAHETVAIPRFVKTDLNLIIENIKSDLELIITQKEATIVVDKLPIINASPSHINRLFYNLINNALKFSKEGVPPVVTIRCKQDTSFVELIITDNGIGFDQEYATRIFNLFQRLNSRHSYIGNGIGLSLCKKIVENHNGEIYAVSEENKGASFHIKFPSTLLVK